MNRITATLLCLVLCLAGTSIPTASAASRLTTSSGTVLTSCLQQEYLMRDTYQNIFATYPTLTAFNAVAADEGKMITTLKKSIFAKYRITMPTDTKVSAAQTITNTATSIWGADTVAISLEQSTATLMTQLLQSADNRDVADAVALIKTTSLGSHATAFTVEQTSAFTPTPTPTPTSTQRIISFTPSQAGSVFLSLLSDESVGVIELSGTYSLPCVTINVNRTNPVVIRPAAGATVVFSGTNGGADGQFHFGYGGTASNITMEGFTFDGYTLGQIGIIWIGNAHDITLNDMVVRSSRCNGQTAAPKNSWALYISSISTMIPTNIAANRWTVDGSARQMSALKVSGGSHISATGWSVVSAYLGIYGYGDRGSLTDFILDDWTISDTGTFAWWTANVSVAIENASGRFSNMHAIDSGALLNQGTPKLTDGGGNSS